MLTYLRCLYLPKQLPTPLIQVLSQNEEHLAFRCSQKLELGICRVTAKSQSAAVDFDVDIYHFEEKYGTYEAQVVPGTQSRSAVTEQEENYECVGLYGELRERFVSGANVRTKRPLRAGSYLSLELEADSQSDEAPVHLAEVMWVKPNSGSSYDVRLRFHRKEEIERISTLDNFSSVLAS